jgi:hypothetical protein
MWEYEHSIEAGVTPQAVWNLYSDATTWQDWDFGIESMDLDGPFLAGSTGRLTPRGRDAIPFTLVHVDENASFTDETIIDGLVLRFIHTLDEVGNGRTKITHRVEISGPTADQVGPHLGPQITDGIPVTVANLAEIAGR